MYQATLFSLLIFISTLFMAWYVLLKITPWFIKVTRERGWLGRDMNKPEKNEVSELGGIPVYIGFVISLMFVLVIYYLFSFYHFSFINLTQLVLIFITMSLMMFIGFVDDVLGWKKGISQLQHFIYPILFSVPMIVFAIIYHINSIYIPFFGVLQLGLIYAWILVPIAIDATTNSFNLLAGFNGLESGLSAIIFTTIAIIAFIRGEITLLIILAAWIGALLGFLEFNKYPSKIFPGDIVTLVSGVLAGISAIILRLEFLIAFLIILFIIEFIIKANHRFRTECFGIPNKNGLLKANPKGGSLTHVVLRFGKGKLNEKNLVLVFYVIQLIISLLTLFFFVF